jgi:ammonia channel protein AmtB
LTHLRASLARRISTFAGLTASIFNPLYVVNGILMGLIVITPLAGFVSPGSALIVGLLCGPIFVYAEKFVGRAKIGGDAVEATTGAPTQLG